MSFDLKFMINFTASIIILTLSLFHFSLFWGRYHLKKDWYSLYLSLIGISIVLTIYSILFLKPGILNIVVINIFITFFIIFTIKALDEVFHFSSISKVFNRIIYLLLSFSLLITIPTLWKGRQWFFNTAFLPVYILGILFTGLLILNIVITVIKYRHWKNPVARYIILGFCFLCLDGVLNRTGQLSRNLFLNFFGKNFIFYIPFYLFFAYGLLIKSNLEFKQLLDLKSSLEQKVKERTAQIHREKEAKTQFFISLAHEAKTPLTLIDNYLEKYKRTHDKSDLQIVSHNIKMLTRMTVDVLDMNKLERCQVLYDHSQILDLSDLVYTRAALFAEIALKKRVRLERIVQSKLYLKADINAIDRILNNLLDNAVKFTPPGGRVQVKLESTQEQVLLSVKDSGPGIKPDQLDLIFRPFSQASKDSRQGIGMGLNLVKQIAEELKGAVYVENGPEKGALFTVYLPLYTVREEEKISKPAVLPGPVHSLPIMQLKKSKIKTGRSNLLVVEDNIDLLAGLQSELESEYNFYPAQNGQEALQILQKIRPHLILSDIMMDSMDGLDLIKNLSPDYKDIPFLFVTARTTREDKLDALDLGAVDYLYKPFDLAELKSKIKAILELSKARQKMIGQKLAQYLSSDEQFEDILPGLSGSKSRSERFGQMADQYQLTKREKEILTLLLKHETPTGLSEKLFISRHTAESHIRNIYKKLNINKKSQLFALFDVD